MKKFQNLKKKSRMAQQVDTTETDARVTNETVLQHRDQVLKKVGNSNTPFIAQNTELLSYLFCL